MLRIFSDAPERWQTNFQEEATPIQAGIIDFHEKALYWLIIILVMVTYLVLRMIPTRKRARTIEWIRMRKHSSILEIIWTITPGLILVIIAIPSLKLLYSLDEVLHPNITVKAIGHQWYWSYEINDIEGISVNFDSYTIDSSESTPETLRLLDVDSPLLLPILVPIRLLVSATDVIHSFFVPSLGIKIDAIPGRLNHFSLYLLRPGTFYGQCAELCGSGHHNMSIVIQGVDLSEYLTWLTTF